MTGAWHISLREKHHSFYPPKPRTAKGTKLWRSVTHHPNASKQGSHLLVTIRNLQGLWTFMNSWEGQWLQLVAINFGQGFAKMHQLDIHCGQSKLIVTIRPILCQWIWLVRSITMNLIGQYNFEPHDVEVQKLVTNYIILLLCSLECTHKRLDKPNS